jgi:hypothetical protein
VDNREDNMGTVGISAVKSGYYFHWMKIRQKAYFLGHLSPHYVDKPEDNLGLIPN